MFSQKAMRWNSRMLLALCLQRITVRARLQAAGPCADVQREKSRRYSATFRYYGGRAMRRQLSLPMNGSAESRQGVSAVHSQTSDWAISKLPRAELDTVV